MAQSIAPRESEADDAPASERFRVSFDVSVTDPQALWHAAAILALRQPGMTIAEVEDILGPAEDPMIADCLAMLTAPQAMSGCAPLGFAVEPIVNLDFMEARERATRSLAVRRFVAISPGATKQ